MIRRMVVIAIIVVAVTGMARAGIINGGFENGLEGWSSEVDHGTYEAGVVSAYTGEKYSFTPLEGTGMLQIFMENPIAHTCQDVFLNQGDTIQGYAGLDTIYLLNASLIFVQISIFDQDGLVDTLWENAGEPFDWTFWTWSATESGEYRLEFGFEPFPAGFSAHTGYAFFDAIEVIESGSATAPVPEPATLFLIGTGLLGVAAVRKRFARS